MAQTGFTPIQIYRSSTASAAPTSGNLVAGELAINTADGKLFYLDSLNAVQVIGWKLVPATAGGTGLSTYTTGDIIYSSATNTLTKLGIGSTGQVLTVAGGVPTWGASGSMVYPGAGIPNSTGSAWDTSYTTSGSGTIVALADSPTFTTAITSTGALQLTGSDTVNQNIATTQTTGSLTVGGTGATGDITLGRSTGAQNINISNGAASTSIVNIGGTGASTGAITIGRSTGAQTVNIATGVNTLSTKTVNIGTGATNAATNITLGPTGTVSGATTINIGTQARITNPTTVNIGTNATGGNSNITLGSSGTSTVITSNGIIQQRIYTGINAQTATAGRKAFVSDHRSATAYPIFGEAYSTSGTFGPFNVPVFADGTIWRVG
jgi:hypothetical protein